MRALVFSPALWFVVDALATFRLARLVTEDTILDRPRNWIRHRFGTEHKMAYFITCPWCTSIWIGAGVVLVTRFGGGIWAYPAAALAFSGVAGFLASVA